jgi:ybaK/ebsC protein
MFFFRDGIIIDEFSSHATMRMRTRKPVSLLKRSIAASEGPRTLAGGKVMATSIPGLRAQGKVRAGGSPDKRPLGLFPRTEASYHFRAEILAEIRKGLFSFVAYNTYMVKTNVMRLLESAHVPFTGHEYDEEIIDGVSVASALHEEPDRVFKTLIARSDKGTLYAFDVPVAAELDLKKAAKAVGAKSIEMIHLKELLPLTGYVHGGCSPIGLKKPYPVYLDETAQLWDTIFVSGGKRGFQIEIAPTDLARFCQASFVPLTV